HQYGLWVARKCDQYNHAAGISWLRSAADNGHVDAQYEYALHLLKANAADPEQVARNYLRHAAEAGHIPARHRLGLEILRRSIVEDEVYDGLRWLGMATTDGHGASALTLATIHERGLYGVRPDPCTALEWYEVRQSLGLMPSWTFRARIKLMLSCRRFHPS
ncbi:MAG: hypothetical protein AAF709_00415, partial [Pseudomonadota bacterium]